MAESQTTPGASGLHRSIGSGFGLWTRQIRPGRSQDGALRSGATPPPSGLHEGEPEWTSAIVHTRLQLCAAARGACARAVACRPSSALHQSAPRPPAYTSAACCGDRGGSMNRRAPPAQPEGVSSGWKLHEGGASNRMRFRVYKRPWAAGAPPAPPGGASSGWKLHKLPDGKQGPGVPAFIQPVSA